VALHPSPAVLAGVAVGTLLAGVAYGALSGSAPLPGKVDLKLNRATPVTQSAAPAGAAQGDAQGSGCRETGRA
jgi:hypothetical protein